MWGSPNLLWLSQCLFLALLQGGAAPTSAPDCIAGSTGAVTGFSVSLGLLTPIPQSIEGAHKGLIPPEE